MLIFVFVKTWGVRFCLLLVHHRVEWFFSRWSDVSPCCADCSPFLPRRSLEETPLMTKALKESQLKEKMERYPKVPRDVVPRHVSMWAHAVCLRTHIHTNSVGQPTLTIPCVYSE